MITSICSTEIAFTDAVAQIAETLILSFYCVDVLQGERLREIVTSFAEPIYTFAGRWVILTLRTPAPFGLPD
jgi:hypothetical protein